MALCVSTSSLTGDHGIELAVAVDLVMFRRGLTADEAYGADAVARPSRRQNRRLLSTDERSILRTPPSSTSVYDVCSS